MKNIYEKLKNENISSVLNEPLSRHTSFKIGGEAKIYIEPENEDHLIFTLKLLDKFNIDYMIIGHGSNLLFSDDGFNGAVIHLSGDFKEIKIENDEIYCGAASSLIKICEEARKNSLTGLEFAYGIPGSAGGAAYMNAGAYGGEMKDVIVSCEYLDEEYNKKIIYSDALDFSYRHSFFSNRSCIILRVNLKLKKGEKQEISALMEDIMGRRKAKQPLEYPSAGSVFKRPEGYFAGALVEELGFKGYSVGGAQVSEKHAGFIINKGGATANDVLTLIKEIQDKVKKEKGVELECEIKRI